jgi:predicted nucleotidyltransferase
MSKSNVLKLNDIRNNLELKKLLDNIKPLSFIVFGSYANNKATMTSDIDFMIFLTRKQILSQNFNELILKIKFNLQSIFNKKIDLIIMLFTNKKIKSYHNLDDFNTNFIYNVLGEGITIYGTQFQNIIEESLIYQKI